MDITDFNIILHLSYLTVIQRRDRSFNKGDRHFSKTSLKRIIENIYVNMLN